MVKPIIFVIITFILFLYILWFKLIKKNDTTYLIILIAQTVGIAINFIKVNFNILNDRIWSILLNIFCIYIPVVVFLLESKKINVSAILKLLMAKIWLWIDNTKKAKKILSDLISKYPENITGHKLIAKIYEKEGRITKSNK